MKVCSKCKQDKDVIFFGKCKFNPDGLRSRCKECNNEESRQWKKQNPIKQFDYNKEWSSLNKDKCKVYAKKYAGNNLSKFASRASKQRAKRLLRIPKWLTTSDWIEIQWAFNIAHKMTRETGIKHEVDHIIPLLGKNISGLHCPQNLRIITKSENSRKSNRY